MAQQRERQVTRAPSTLVSLASRLEDYANQLELGMKLGSLIQPRAIFTVVKGTENAVVSKDD
eukprot:350214-Prorocentrum_lima.AAC.1